MTTLGTEIEQIDLNRLSPCQRYRFQLHVSEDGTGRPVRVPLLVIRGKHDGPVLGITAALHGNEINGIPVIHRLSSDLEPTRLSGTIIAALVTNVPGFILQKRRFPDSTDLNTIMPGDEYGNVSQTYAARIHDRLLAKFDALIDLHTASRGRINSLYARADMEECRSAMMARRLRPQIIVHKEARDGSLRGEAANIGIPSVTLEIGDPQLFQPEFIKKSVQGIKAVMYEMKMIKGRPFEEKKKPNVCGSSFWVFTNHGGILSVIPKLREIVQQGDEIGIVRNIFGDVVQRIQAPEDGIVIGKSVNPVGYAGARVAHIGRLV